jgi:hypothetical protein
MIDYDKEDEDPIVAEVRRAREEIFAEYGYDLRAMFEAFQQREATSGHTYASPATRADTSLQPKDATKKVG